MDDDNFASEDADDENHKAFKGDGENNISGTDSITRSDDDINDSEDDDNDDEGEEMKLMMKLVLIRRM